MVIDEYLNGGYWCLLMAIGGSSINGYYWIFEWWIFVLINGYWWVFY